MRTALRAPLTLIAAATLQSGCAAADVPSPQWRQFEVISLHATFEDRWSEPIHLPAPINSEHRELGGAFSPDGLSMYFGSDRPNGGHGGFDIWVTRRACSQCEWGDPANLGPLINSPTGDGVPSFSRDGRMMVFSGGHRDGGFGGEDLWLSRRDDPNDDLGWDSPVNLGPLVNSAANEGNPHLFFRASDGDADLVYFRGQVAYQARISREGHILDGTSPVAEINDPPPSTDDLQLEGAEALFFHRTGGFGGSDLWVSVRANGNRAWSAPRNLGPVINTTGADLQPAWDGPRTLVFGAGANARETLGLQDLWVTTYRGRGAPR